MFASQDQLEGHDSVQTEVSRPIDDAHSAAADSLKQLIAAKELAVLVAVSCKNSSVWGTQIIRARARQCHLVRLAAGHDAVDLEELVQFLAPLRKPLEPLLRPRLLT